MPFGWLRSIAGATPNCQAPSLYCRHGRYTCGSKPNWMRGVSGSTSPCAESGRPPKPHCAPVCTAVPADQSSSSAQAVRVRVSCGSTVMRMSLPAAPGALARICTWRASRRACSVGMPRSTSDSVSPCRGAAPSTARTLSLPLPTPTNCGTEARGMPPAATISTSRSAPSCPV